MPSRFAAAEPSTATGSWAAPSLSPLPPAPPVAGRGERGAQRPGAQPDTRYPQPVLQPQSFAPGTQGTAPLTPRTVHGRHKDAAIAAGIGDHLAVQHPYLARQLIGEARIVRDHDDGG